MQIFKLVFYVPEDHAEAVKRAVFEAGAGRMGNYDSCAWQVLGEGQFRPLEGSDPFLGKQGEVERVSEYRVETICTEDKLKSVVAALHQAHPYEEPAFDVWKLETVAP